MCGRYRLSRRAEVLRDRFGIDTEVDWAPRWNIAPTDAVAIVRQRAEEPRREFVKMRWGLIPAWSKNPPSGAPLINARAETAAALPAFRDAFRSRRCLIAADGFYEWQKRDGRRQPFAFTMADDEVFGFAGLWDRWRTPGGAFLQSCAILTTTPNQLVADVHDRMPVILQPDSYDLWLDPGFSNVAALREMLQPFPAGAMRKHAVSERVNSVKNDDAGVCEPPAAAQAAQTGLFA